MGIAHDYLVQRAVRWLKNTKRCPIVVYEFVSSSPETPDALGWTQCGFNSVLVECKTSIADLRADKHKSFRRRGDSIGTERYYMTPANLVRDDLIDHYIPEGWGLLEIHGKVVMVKRKAVWVARSVMSFRSEIGIMYSILRRAQLSGEAVKSCDFTWVLERLTSPSDAAPPSADDSGQCTKSPAPEDP